MALVTHFEAALRLREEKVDALCRLFIQEVVEKNFGG